MCGIPKSRHSHNACHPTHILLHSLCHPFLLSNWIHRPSPLQLHRKHPGRRNSPEFLLGRLTVKLLQMEILLKPSEMWHQPFSQKYSKMWREFVILLFNIYRTPTPTIEEITYVAVIMNSRLFHVPHITKELGFSTVVFRSLRVVIDYKIPTPLKVKPFRYNQLIQPSFSLIFDFIF